MDLSQFEVMKFLGRGGYSMLYEATCKRECNNRNDSYAVKRIFMRNPVAINCAIREQKILLRLAIMSTHCSVLETLYLSYFHKDTPVLGLSKGSGFDLSIC